MNQSFELKAEKRSSLGTAPSRRMRKEGKIPAVVYGGGSAPADVILSHSAILKSLENEAFYSHVLSIEVDGKKEDVLLKDVHRHPNGKHILHLDFLRVGADTKIRKLVPIHFVGEDVAPGVKLGGQLTHTMNSVEIVCLVKDLPEFIEVDLSNLGLGETFHLTDIKLAEGMKIAELMQGGDHNQSVAVIHKPRGASADETEEAAEEPEAE